jgi:hypothetical protein
MCDGHICDACSSKMVVTQMVVTDPDNPNEQKHLGLGWILPCETFKNIPVIDGIKPDNISNMRLKDAFNGKSQYINIVNLLKECFFKQKDHLRYDYCFGLFLKRVLIDENGNLNEKIMPPELYVEKYGDFRYKPTEDVK